MSQDAPKRIQLKRTKGWRKPEGSIVVSRPSVWGNPYAAKWSDCSTGTLCWKLVWLPNGEVVQDHLNSQRDARQAAVDAYRSYVEYEATVPWIRELAGHDLACWCPLGEPCHADVLLQIANSFSGAAVSGVGGVPE